jgi:phage-related protein
MAAEPVDRRSQGDRNRPRDPASRMAVGMPLCRSLGAGLWEVRSKLANNRIARLIFFVAEGRIGALHGFIKKTQKTPPAEIALAKKRMKEMMK